jgi:hypothetical protein
MKFVNGSCRMNLCHELEYNFIYYAMAAYISHHEHAPTSIFKFENFLKERLATRRIPEMAITREDYPDQLDEARRMVATFYPDLRP